MAHSQRLNDAKLLPWLILKNCGDVCSAHCTCMAGLGECCSHVGALLFYLEYACSKKSQSKSVTYVSAYWVAPSNKNVEFLQINNIDFNHPKNINLEYGPTKKCKIDFTKKLSTTLDDHQTFKTFMSKLNVINSNAAILKVVPPYNLHFKKDTFPKSYIDLYTDDNARLKKEELLKLGSEMDFSIDNSDCDKINLDTRLQSKSKAWFSYRSGRITASKVKDVCSVKSYDSNIGLIKSICYPLANSFKNKVTEWGITHETDGKLFYMDKLKNNHTNVSVNSCGLIINPKFPFLGASPDGIIYCDCCGKGCLEIKFPYSLTQGRYLDSLNYLSNGKLQTKSQYFYQIQTQLLLSEVKYGDFVIWSPGECHIERIFINNDVCLEIIAKSKWFFYEAIIPELLGRYYTNRTVNEQSNVEEDGIPTSNSYCTCKQNIGGKMIMCTQEGCPNLWYHYKCLGLQRKPTTKKWKCTICKFK